MELSNAKIAKLLRDIAAAYSIMGNKSIFEIRAYENAADSVEHSTTEIQDLWQEGKLDQVPGLGEKLQSYLDELFKTGKVQHFETVRKDIPEVVFELLDVPGIGPKTAQEIAKLGVKSIDDLKKQIKSGDLVKKGFSGKLAQKVMDGISELNSRGGRMLLPYATAQAERILAQLKKIKGIERTDSLGSLRRGVATIGDLDFAASSRQPEKVVEEFCKMPGVVRVLDQGQNQPKVGNYVSRASVVLQSGIQADLLVGQPESYGALLQHFTGSKSHNIHLRVVAGQKGMSLSEYGVKFTKTGKLVTARSEEEFYQQLGMDIPPPEIREDTGEIEAALAHKLPKLVELADIKGDLHLHSDFPLEPSHGPGVNTIGEIVKSAIDLGYHYIGIADHSPAFTTHTKEEVVKLVEKRTKFIQSLKKDLSAGRQGTKSVRVQHAESNTRSVRILNGLEIDILGDGTLSVPDEVLKSLDYCIAGIHSGHRDSKEQITKRLLSALENPYVDIISHPTGRLVNERESSDADWEQIFKMCAKNHKLLEINAFPNRLDLRDDLVRLALKYGVKFAVDTDAHEISQMNNMKFGVSIARRGWATKADIVNTWDWTDFAKWFKL